MCPLMIDLLGQCSESGNPITLLGQMCHLVSVDDPLMSHQNNKTSIS